MHYLLRLIGQGGYKHKMVQVYETSLLDPMWWVNSLLGSTVMLVIIIELLILSYVRKIPNIKTFSMILIALNGAIMLFAIFAGEGLTLTSGLLVFLMAIFGYFAFSGFSDG